MRVKVRLRRYNCMSAWVWAMSVYPKTQGIERALLPALTDTLIVMVSWKLTSSATMRCRASAVSGAAEE